MDITQILSADFCTQRDKQCCSLECEEYDGIQEKESRTDKA